MEVRLVRRRGGPPRGGTPLEKTIKDMMGPVAIRIELPWPPSVNKYWRHNRGRTHISAEGKAYRSHVATQCMVDRVPKLGSERLAMLIEAYPPDNRRRDLDNILKAPLDALGKHEDHGAPGAGVYDDDSQIDELKVTRMPAEKPGRMVVTIEVMQ